VSWIGFIAGRLASRRRALPLLSILGIAVGVLALTVIIAVMNGFQLGFIESILEISSYYLRVESPPAGKTGRELAEKIRSLPGVRAVVPFREIQGLIRSGSGQQAVVIRGLPPGAPEDDPGMAAKLDFESGFFDLETPDSILLGAELARRLRVRKGGVVTVLSINALVPGQSGTDLAGGPLSTDFTVTGIFRSGFYEYDLNWAFVNFERSGELEGEDYILGIKLADRWRDGKILPVIQQLSSRRVRSWREYNRAFFGALRTEKLFMFVLVGLIFIVVGLNIYQAQRRTVLERREEIGLLRAVGAGDRAVRLVFVWDGFLIGFFGASAGMAIGLLISLNISGFFSLLEKTVNAVLCAASAVLSPFSENAVPDGEFAVFSPAVFYIKEISGRVIPHEAVIIFLFGLFSALGAAWFASRKVSRIRPAEVLRYE
jgi:lipoprotein-releasing system permease protein